MPTFAANARPRILVVDDQEIIRYSMDSVFTNQGYRVSVASSVAEASVVLASQRPDLVILDLSMPVADGMVLLRQMRASPTYRLTPVIILTAYSDRNFVIEAVQLGTRDYVVKAGLAIEDLVARVRLRLEERGLLEPVTAPRPGSPRPVTAGPALDLARFLETIKGRNCGRVLPAVRDQVQGLIRSSITSVPEIVEIIREDPVLSLRVLRSACSAAAARILDLEEAVSVLGMDVMQSLLESCDVFEPGMDAEIAQDIARLWGHSIFCSRLMEQVAPQIELAGLVGLFHDLPTILLASTLSAKDWGEIRGRVMSSGHLFTDVVAELFGVPYGEFCNAVFNDAGLPDYLMPSIAEYASVFLDAMPISPTHDAWLLEMVRHWSGTLLLPQISSIALRIPSKEECALVTELPTRDELEGLADQVWQDVCRLGIDFLPQGLERVPARNPDKRLRLAVRKEGWTGSAFALLYFLGLLGDVVGPEAIPSGQWDVFVYLGNHPARLWPVGFPYQKPLLILHRLSEGKCDFPGGKSSMSLQLPCSLARLSQVFESMGARVGVAK